MTSGAIKTKKVIKYLENKQQELSQKIKRKMEDFDKLKQVKGKQKKKQIELVQEEKSQDEESDDARQE
jgi:hypothetical protein